MSQAHFVDTSALLKRYVLELGTEALQQRCFADPGIEIFVSTLTYAEAYATFGRLVREGDLTAGEHESILSSFESDWSSFVKVEIGSAVCRCVPDLARAYSLRGADLVQLASATYLRARRALDLFVVCDVRLANAALSLAFPLFNPEVG
ncbi:MAG: type II toxin-antitoxin system VapC family toxin [Deltaproteobacteria bacterium]|nr:type II toxin-antitoxin system VapC family toxin [Deltaproteobacteria bacterium]